jgi:hypothetical protein
MAQTINKPRRSVVEAVAAAAAAVPAAAVVVVDTTASDLKCKTVHACAEYKLCTAPQQHSTTVELVYFSSKTWFFIDTRPINTAGPRLCIDQDDVRMCLGDVMCLEATLNSHTFKHSTQS